MGEESAERGRKPEVASAAQKQTEDCEPVEEPISPTRTQLVTQNGYDSSIGKRNF